MAERQKDKQTKRQKDRLTNRQKVRKTDRQLKHFFTFLILDPTADGDSLDFSFCVHSLFVVGAQQVALFLLDALQGGGVRGAAP